MPGFAAPAPPTTMPSLERQAIPCRSSVKGARLRYGDGMDCTVAELDDSGETYQARLACTGEGMAQPDQHWTLGKRSDSSFEKDGKLFSLCPEDAEPAAIAEGLGTEATEAALALSRTERRDVQRRLKLLGHDPGGTDGVLGRRSREAIAAWQSHQGVAATGHLNASQLAALRSQSEQAYTQWQASIPRSPPRTRAVKVCTSLGLVRVCRIKR